MNYDFSVNYNWLIIIHVFVNMGDIFICMKRLDQMQDVLLRVKLQYVVLTVASLANAFSPVFFRAWPTIVSIFYASAVFYMLASDRYQWTKGPPPESFTDRAPLEPTT